MPPGALRAMRCQGRRGGSRPTGAGKGSAQGAGAANTSVLAEPRATLALLRRGSHKMARRGEVTVDHTGIGPRRRSASICTGVPGPLRRQTARRGATEEQGLAAICKIRPNEPAKLLQKGIGHAAGRPRRVPAR
eukprot:2584039-Alexandrium_andersonii.AAC.1